MKKPHVQFLTVSFVISWACFAIMAAAQTPFGTLVQQPRYILLFGLGCLGPLLATGFVYLLPQNKMGGLQGLWQTVRAVKNPKMLYLIPLFLAIHYGFAIVFRQVGAYGQYLNFFKFLPLMLLLFGTQEVGWRVIAQPGLEEGRGFWKSGFAVGLLQAMWFLPLLFIPGFVAGPDFFIQFAAYILGLSLVLTTLYKKTGSAGACIGYATVFYAMTVLFSLKLSNMIIALAVVDFALAFLYNSKTFIKENQEA